MFFCQAAYPIVDNICELVGVFGVEVRDAERIDCPLNSPSVGITEIIAVPFAQRVGFKADAIRSKHLGLPAHQNLVQKVPTIVSSPENVRNSLELVALSSRLDSFKLCRVFPLGVSRQHTIGE